ncbi:MAG: hypothetical protein AAF481_18950 [Acidobacteriota bacterium]
MKTKGNSRVGKALWVFTIAGIGCWMAGAAAAEELARLRNLEAGATASEGFRLSTVGEVRIEAVMPAKSIRFGEAAAAWILDAETRQPVWVLRQEDADDTSRNRFEVTEDITLQAGRYEIWVATVAERNWDNPNSDSWVDQAARWMFGLEAHEKAVEVIDVRLTGPGESLSAVERERWAEERRASRVVDFTGVEDKQHRRRGLEVSEPVTLRLQAIGEVTDRGLYDFGWVADADSGEVYWMLDRAASRQGGGADKNRRFDGSVDLPAGRYIAAFVSDDSHATDAWNAPPPWDPTGWGLVLAADSPEDRAKITEFDPASLFEERTLARLPGDATSETRDLSFVLSRGASLRVQAVGEGVSGQMYDYGWMIDQVTGERVWEQRFETTVAAGGAAKNRRSDEVLALPAGRYTAYFTTDGSHSMGSWNAGPPPNPERWGLTLLAPDEGFDRGVFRRQRQVEGGEGVVAQIQRVGSRAHSSKDFALEQETRLHLVVIGEGRSGRMYDYAWIETRPAGERVWEMDYDDTEPAGGASKNRMFRGSVTLPVGRYTVHYKTDGSHAFGDWNQAPPSRPDAWGVLMTVGGSG